MKHSILIVADFPNWAYYEIQQFIKNNLSDDYHIYTDFLIFNTIKKSKNPLKRFKSLIERKKYVNIKKDKSYDIVLYLAFYFDKEMKVNWQAQKIIKGIYTDGFPPSNANFSGSIDQFIQYFFSDVSAIVCGSQIITDFYSEKFQRAYYANGVMDDTLFRRIQEKRIDKKNKFIIGWTGNPKREFKGYYSHVVKAVEVLKLKHPNIELKSRFSGPMETLPDFYDDVDLVLIASDADAGPAMFGEAALMNIPSVSTNIGWPSQVIQDGINGFIVKKDVDEMVAKIEKLYNDRPLLDKMSGRIRADFQKEFNKQEMIGRWKTLFTDVLNIKK